MMLFLAVILFIAGILMLVKPKIVWQITEQWKSSAAEGPSDFYIKSIRFGGVMLILAGVCSLVAFFLK